MLSIFGVQPIIPWVYAPTFQYPMSSPQITTMLGFCCARASIASKVKATTAARNAHRNHQLRSEPEVHTSSFRIIKCLLLIFSVYRKGGENRARVLVDLLPLTVGVVGFNRRGQLLGFVAKIALVNDAVLVHHEGLYAGISVFRGIGQEGESADQSASREIVDRTTFGGRALLCEDAVEVAVKRSHVSLLHVVAFGVSEREHGTNGTRGFVLRGLPVEPVVFAFGAYEERRICAGGSPVARSRRILSLCAHQLLENFDGVVFIPADAPVEDFLHTRLCIEIPAPAGIFLDGYRKRPVIRSDVKRSGLVWFNDDATHLVIAPYEIRHSILIGNVVARVQNGVCIRAKNRGERLVILRFCGGVECKRRVSR